MEHCVIAVAWYSEDEYEKFKRSSLDPKSWFDEHESWEKSAQSTLQKFTIEGYMVVKVPMFLHEFQDWCKKSKSKNDGKGRSEYATWKSQQS